MGSPAALFKGAPHVPVAVGFFKSRDVLLAEVRRFEDAILRFLITPEVALRRFCLSLVLDASDLESSRRGRDRWGTIMSSIFTGENRGC